jgi:hypothetical protein
MPVWQFQKVAAVAGVERILATVTAGMEVVKVIFYVPMIIIFIHRHTF